MTERQIVLIKDIRGDYPFGHHTVAAAGVYVPYVNPHGAIFVWAKCGEAWVKMGLKPGEYEWLN